MKKAIRKEMKIRRKNLDKVNKEVSDKLIIDRLISSEEYKNSKVLFIYVSTDEEIETLTLIKHSLEVGKTVAVPKVISKEKGMKAVKINSLDDLSIKGAFGILEPDESNEDINEEIDLILVPGLAFDSYGNRIGYGGGFYDRFIRQSRNSKIVGICYSFQLVNNLEAEDFDEKVEKIITDKGSINIK